MGRPSPFACAANQTSRGGAAHLSSIGRFALYNAAERGGCHAPTGFCASPAPPLGCSSPEPGGRNTPSTGSGGGTPENVVMPALPVRVTKGGSFEGPVAGATGAPPTTAGGGPICRPPPMSQPPGMRYANPFGNAGQRRGTTPPPAVRQAADAQRQQLTGNSPATASSNPHPPFHHHPGARAPPPFASQGRCTPAPCSSPVPGAAGASLSAPAAPALSPPMQQAAAAAAAGGGGDRWPAPPGGVSSASAPAGASAQAAVDAAMSNWPRTPRQMTRSNSAPLVDAGLLQPQTNGEESAVVVEKTASAGPAAGTALPGGLPAHVAPRHTAQAGGAGSCGPSRRYSGASTPLPSKAPAAQVAPSAVPKYGAGERCATPPRTATGVRASTPTGRAGSGIQRRQNTVTPPRGSTPRGHAAGGPAAPFRGGGGGVGISYPQALARPLEPTQPSQSTGPAAKENASSGVGVSAAQSLQLATSADLAAEAGDESSAKRRFPCGLGAIQPDGRAEVLQQWHEQDQQLRLRQQALERDSRRHSVDQRATLSTPRGGSTRRSTATQQLHSFALTGERQMTPRGSAGGAIGTIECLGGAGEGGEGNPKLEWSSLSRKSRAAIRQWVNREIGGRHCLMLLEHENAIDFLISPLDPDEVLSADLRSAAVLNALSGLKAETQTNRDGSWLYRELFAKSAPQALEEALEAARSDAGGVPVTPRGGCGLPLEQVNLALRRLAMRAQSSGMQTLVESAQRRAECDAPRCSEEYMRVQVWLELLRLHTDGVSLYGPTPGSVARGSTATPVYAATHSGGFSEAAQQQLLPQHGGSQLGGGGGGTEGKQQRGSAEQRASSLRAGQAAAAAAQSAATSTQQPQQLWDDRSVLGELGKAEAELEVESKQMSLDVLRAQNRSIEAYLMRLVRQRDELRHIARLADECDSYFILGLTGPDASEAEVKQAYRTLARKEHPDKAGTENKERFQQIQEAYSFVLKQRRRSGKDVGEDPPLPGGSEMVAATSSIGAKASAAAAAAEKEQPQAIGAPAREATAYAAQAQGCADEAAGAAHRSFRLCRSASDLRGSQKRCALRELRELTREGTRNLRNNARLLRAVRENVVCVARAAQAALDEYGDWADTAIAGAGLRERATVAGNLARSNMSTADLLEKICEANEANVKKAERVSNSSASESMNGARLLGKSLVRTASVARCAADETIGAATTALELSCSLVALDREWRREKCREAERKFGAEAFPAEEGRRPEGSSSAASPSGRSHGDEEADADGEKDKAEDSKDGEDKAKSEKPELSDRDPKSSDAADENLTPSERARKEHVSLRVRNLRCLGGLNEEVLQLQVQLRGLLDRSRGALLPAVSVPQKGGVFDLVSQILNSALNEATIRAGDTGMLAKQVLEHSFAFALALEHTKEVALSSEVKTQVLKLAALVDVELLCQIVDGPFRRRLLTVSTQRSSAGASVGKAPTGTEQQSSSSGRHGGVLSYAQTLTSAVANAASPMRSGTHRSNSLRKNQAQQPSPGHTPRGNASGDNWEKAAHMLCGRLLKCLRNASASDKAKMHGQQATAAAT
eukprot:TRINITY_DN5802_c0_g2_i1.p1 TRINITY_DN5802_c0_g2~~TRINITY_DN5802_c0_g2_i1.p1  ORF type:complete len:1562 (+),score=386.58 TRINITY_DN5802_c0_g2_i1:153-4838(+)